MGIAAGVVAHRPAPSRLRCVYDDSVRAHFDRRFPPGDRPSGSFSNEHGQQPFRVEVADAKGPIHRVFARPAARGRDCGEMRWPVGPQWELWPVLRPGKERMKGSHPAFLRATAPGNSHCTPTPTLNPVRRTRDDPRARRRGGLHAGTFSASASTGAASPAQRSTMKTFT
jgi:hypothetical protein